MLYKSHNSLENTTAFTFNIYWSIFLLRMKPVLNGDLLWNPCYTLWPGFKKQHHHRGLLGSLCSVNSVLNGTVSQLEPWRRYTVWPPSNHNHTRLNSDSRPSGHPNCVKSRLWAKTFQKQLVKKWSHYPSKPPNHPNTLYDSAVFASLIWGGRLQAQVYNAQNKVEIGMTKDFPNYVKSSQSRRQNMSALHYSQPRTFSPQDMNVE